MRQLILSILFLILISCWAGDINTYQRPVFKKHKTSLLNLSRYRKPQSQKSIIPTTQSSDDNILSNNEALDATEKIIYTQQTLSPTCDGAHQISPTIVVKVEDNRQPRRSLLNLSSMHIVRISTASGGSSHRHLLRKSPSPPSKNASLPTMSNSRTSPILSTVISRTTSTQQNGAGTTM
jgi:hypothetical protein